MESLEGFLPFCVSLSYYLCSLFSLSLHSECYWCLQDCHSWQKTVCLMRSIFFSFSAGAQALPSLDGNKSRFGKEKLNSSVSVFFFLPFSIFGASWPLIKNLTSVSLHIVHNAAVTRLSSWVQYLCFHRYAICNEKTLQKIAKLRPSTEARLRNIDGVNQVNSLSIVPNLFSVAVLHNSRVFMCQNLQILCGFTEIGILQESDNVPWAIPWLQRFQIHSCLLSWVVSGWWQSMVQRYLQQSKDMQQIWIWLLTLWRR